MQQSAHERVVQPAMASVARRARRITPAGMVSGLEHRVMLAGMGDEWPIDRVLAMKLIAGSAGAFLGLVILVANPSLFGVLLLLLVAGIGFMLPDVLIARRADDRQREIERRSRRRARSDHRVRRSRSVVRSRGRHVSPKAKVRLRRS